MVGADAAKPVRFDFIVAVRTALGARRSKFAIKHMITKLRSLNIYIIVKSENHKIFTCDKVCSYNIHVYCHSLKVFALVIQSEGVCTSDSV